MRTKKGKLIYNLITFGLVTAAFLICNSMLQSGSMSRTLKGQLVPICAWIVMAISLNLVIGISGELSLGHAGFMSVGAFTGIVVSGWLLNGFQVENDALRLVIAMVAGGVAAGVAGVIIGIPVLRLRGDYLAIVTLAFGEIIRNVMNCVYVSVEVQRISTFLAGFLLVIFTLVVVLNLINSRSGRAIMAIRDNRIAAESMGINVTKYKMMAFVLSAVLAGMAGALYGLNMNTLVPAKFKFDQSINVLVFVVLGGIGNILGSVISATLLTVLLRAFSQFRMLVYAIVLIVVMLATNNPLLRSWFNQLTAKVKGRITGRDGQTTKGGGAA